MEDKAGEKVGAGEEEVKGGAQEKFIKGGSQLRLNCHLRKATEPPAYIFWYHNKTMVNYSPDLGRAVYTHQDGMGSTLTVSLDLNMTLVTHNFDPFPAMSRSPAWVRMTGVTTPAPRPTSTPTP